MKKKYYSVIIFSVCLIFYGGIAQGDLLDTAFQVSKNMDHIIDIGNSKNAVGNEVFRGSSELDISKKCYEPLSITPNQEDICISSKGKRKDNVCFNVAPLVYEDKDSCINNGGERMQLESVIQSRDSLLVRITKTLLRITIALSISMIIFIGVKTIINAIKGEDYSKSLQDIVLVVSGLILALSAIGIINLIQSITINSLSGVSPVG